MKTNRGRRKGNAVAREKSLLLSDLQRVVVRELRQHSCPRIAEAADRFWKRNEGYYIDARVKCSRWLRRLFVKANDEIELGRRRR